jgi:hypothetical protein
MSEVTIALAQGYLKRMSADLKQNRIINLSLLHLTPKNADALKIELKRLKDAFMRQSEIDKALDPGKLLVQSLLLSVADGSFI